jgi:hypothetical protein
MIFCSGFASNHWRPQHDERLLHLPRLHLQEVGLGGHQGQTPQAGQAHLHADLLHHGQKVREPGLDTRFQFLKTFFFVTDSWARVLVLGWFLAK